MFVHARVAGLMALMATMDCFDADDCAGKVIPAMAGLLVDKERYVGSPRGTPSDNWCHRIVRDQAFKCLELYRQKLETYVASMVRD